MPSLIPRLDRLPPYVFVTISQNVQRLAAAGYDIIRLDIGNPDMPPPDHVTERMAHAVMNPALHGYAGYRGVPAFRQAVADYYEKRFAVELNPETEVLPLLGSKEGVVNLIMAHADEGVGVLVPQISYPAYEMGTLLAGGHVILVPNPEECDYLVDLDNISPDDAKNASMLWINYPNNPTGSMATPAFYEQAVQFCKANDILLASDNPYVEVVYDNNTAGSALQAPGAKETAVEFMSFSKTYNMAGWRLGAAVGNAEALRRLLNIKSNMDSGHFKATYEAGIAALRDTSHEWLEERNAIYQQRRDKLMQALPYIGLSARKPGGSMYIWAKIEAEMSSEDYVLGALNHAHVSVAPGTAYGEHGEGYVRLSLGVPDDRLDQGIERLKIWYSRG